ncbi:MAG: AI-2E family transporter [Methanomicrobiales archaeon HGW-Methanomicrobiales-1]|jgi:predicted PurR-regulated permease PerM|nr:MAG: AI-2E family transporter [Methanomicrobiales archaeon HGW-Methanomicrobiales-1]
MIPAGISRTERIVLFIALIVIIILAVKMTAYIVTLFVMALILTLLALPGLFWLKEKGLSYFHATLIITVIASVLILGFFFLTFLSFHTLLADLPQYQAELNNRLQEISTILSSYGISSVSNGEPTINLSQILSVALGGAMSVIDGIMFLFFVGITTFFMLLDAPNISTRLEQRFGKDSETMQQFSRMTGYITDFIVVRTETNFVHGVLFGSFLGIMGVQGAILWGVLTFLLGYIPYFGLVIAAVPAIFFAWIQFGIPGAVAVIAAVCVLNLVVENPVYSFLAARKFDMPALIVIVSVIFWGWLLGLVGMLFAIPITLLVLMVFQMCDELRWINAALGVGHLFEELGNKNKGQEIEH